MGPHFRLLHRTIYRYERPVRLGPQWLRLRPLPDPRRPDPLYTLTVDPEPSSCHWFPDPLGNIVARLVVADAIERLTIEVALELDLTPRNPFDFVLAPDAAQWPFRYDMDDADALAIWRRMDLAGPRLQALRDETAATMDTIPLLLALAGRVLGRVAYITRMEAGVWLPEYTLERSEGSCRDSAWLLVQLLRMHGIAARFVSGYLIQQPEPGAPPEARAAAELHAWAEAYLPGAGWIGIDATSGMLTAEGHVALAASPGPLGAAPLEGTVEPGRVELDTAIELERL